MNILVNLGAQWAINLDEWENKYRVGEAFDKMPYGYCWVEDYDTNITYLTLSKFEKNIFFNIDILLKLYFYLIKMPLISLRYDMIWTHNDRELLFYGFLKSLPIFKNIPPIIGNIIWLTDKTISDKKKAQYKKYLNKVSYITVLSKVQIKILEEEFGVNREKINFVRYGLNNDIYSDKINLSKPKKVKENEDFILMVGTDIDRDIDLFKKITSEFPNDKFIFATNNKDYLNDKYNDNVLTIQCSLKEMKWLYSRCKYIIMPLKINAHASGCTTMIEAGLQGKAIITNDIDGLQDYYIKNITCKIVDINNIKEFSNMMIKLENEKYREQIGKNAYNFFKVNNDFTSKTYANEFLKLSKLAIK